MTELVLTLVELTQQRQIEQQKSTYLVKSQICDFCTLCRPCTYFFICIYTCGREEIGSEVQEDDVEFSIRFLHFYRPVHGQFNLGTVYALF